MKDRGCQNAVISCATLMEELLPFMPSHIARRSLDPELHRRPDKLHRTIQENIDGLAEIFAGNGSPLNVIMGYGLCSRALEGIRANNCRLVIPRVDNCVAIFLGSRQAYRDQLFYQPGTYYLTGGGVRAAKTPFHDYKQAVRRFGKKKARSLLSIMMARYQRLALINTGQYKIGVYRRYARRLARLFGMDYEEIQGSTLFLEKMLAGPWDEDFIIVNPGEKVRLVDFLN